ncbi:hypothetical protein [Streptomyces sp. M41(2017)]|uniref:hypothetical protein n=1 Tax=Streptomyces sp. M41(2017) TaxID=1955065 RepID=UPI001F4E6629|nr:hypothetical protein [Streptomyces sp. M41(2017)]
MTYGRDGRLTVYALAEGGLQRWTETAVGGPSWSGPHLVSVPDLTHVSVAQGVNSYVHFFGRRERTGTDGVPTVDVVHAIQYQTGLAFTDWRSLGNPHKDPEQGRRIGPPVGVVSGDGSVHVFTRGAHGGLLLRREDSKGKWRTWEDLRGGGLDPWPVPVAVSDGRVEVVAAAETGVMTWGQTAPGGDFAGPRGFSLRPAPGTVSVLETGPARPTFFWTNADNSSGEAWRAGTWPQPLGAVGPASGYATLRAQVDGYDCVILAFRDATGRAVVGLGTTENESGGFWWYPQEQCQGTPALATDGRGRIAVALIGEDGRPRVARQNGAGLSLSPWQHV